MAPSQELDALRERAKELRCLYRINQAVARREAPPHAVFHEVLEGIPDGWQVPEETGARIEYFSRSYVGPRFEARRDHRMTARLRMFGTDVGLIEVTSSEEFLPEEQELIESIAARLSDYLEWKHQQLGSDRIGGGTEHWSWRETFAQRLADNVDRARFGVDRIYLGGSTGAGNAGPGSDIDLVILFRGTNDQRRALDLWLEGWSLCLAEISYQHTGYHVTGGLLDIRYVEEEPSAMERFHLREL